MRPSNSRFGKLTRPRLGNTVPRERLFNLLDEARRVRSTIGVVAPPGFGKTTLVASWLEARGIKGIWYQADSGDMDLATFFYFLGEAANGFTRKGHRPLPPFTPEYMADVLGFARRTFRDIYSRLPQNSAVVLDNYQELEGCHAIDDVLAQAIADVPHGVVLILISRSSLPNAFIRATANSDLGLIDGRSLELTPEEVAAIAKSRGAPNNQDVERLRKAARGWAAGLTLALEIRDAGGLSHEDTREAFFQYFATVVLDRAPANVKDVLLRTSALPYISPGIATRLTGDVHADQILRELHRRNLFTDRRSNVVPSYQYHSLFREFLMAEARRVLPAAEQARLTKLAAQLMAEAGDAEAAIALSNEVGDWELTTQIAVSQAPDLLAKGRWQTLDTWLAPLPAIQYERQPWLEYWRGVSRLSLDPPMAQRYLSAAYGRFVDSGDIYGQTLSAAAIAQAIYLESAAFDKLDPWLPILERLFVAPPTFPDPGGELLAWSGLLVALTFRCPAHPLVRPSAQRMLELLELPIDANQRLTSAGSLMLLCGYTAWLEGGAQVLAVAGPIVDTTVVTPLNAAVWHAYAGYWGLVTHQAEWGLEQLAKAKAIASEESFPFVLTVAYSIESALMRNSDPVGARAAIAKAESLVNQSRPYDVAHYLGNMLYRTCDDGEFETAVEFGRRTFEYLRGTGTLFQALIWNMPFGWALAELGRVQEATEALAHSRSLIEKTGATCYMALHLLCSANLARARGDTHQYRSLLTEGLARARMDPAEANLLFWMPPRGGASRVLGDALHYKIEVTLVERLIREFPLRPPLNAPETWPWPIRVYALGEFRVLLEGRPLTFGRKAPRKLIALLKALMALGGRGVGQQKLIDALWPSEEGDGAYQSFWLALHRLRKLLRTESAIELEDGKVTLNPDVVWTDVAAFEHATNADSSLAVDIYRGQFLPEDDDAPWAASKRERLRGLFIREIAKLGRSLEKAQRWDDALGLYGRGIDADQLVEEFYQGSMRCYVSLARPTDAYRVYRNFRKLLSVTLGLEPSPMTEAMAKNLGQN